MYATSLYERYRDGSRIVKQGIIIAGIVLIAASVITIGLTHAQKIKSNSTESNNTVYVDLFADRAEPSTVSVEKGEYVQFNGKDETIHNIGRGSGAGVNHEAYKASESDHEHTEEDTSVSHDHAESDAHEHLAGEESGSFGEGQFYRVQLDKVGTFTFHDHLNPEISIVVQVYEPGSQ